MKEKRISVLMKTDITAIKGNDRIELIQFKKQNPKAHE